MIKARKKSMIDEPQYMSHDTCTAIDLLGTNFKFKRGSRYPDSREYDPDGKDKRAARQLHDNYKAFTRSLEQMKNDLYFAYSKSAHPNVIKSGMFNRY